MESKPDSPKRAALPPPLDCDANAARRKMVTYSLGAAIGMGALGYVFSLYFHDDTWRQGAGVDERDRQRATQLRGALTSIASSLSFGLMVMTLNSRAYVQQLSSVALMSLTLGNIIGFVADVAFASDTGAGHVLANSNDKAMRHGFAALTTTDFARYLVSMLLDLFISSILVDRILAVVQNASFAGGALRSAQAFAQCPPGNALMPTLATVLVSTITFYAYTNATRFLFAIRPSRFPQTPQEYAKRAMQSTAYATLPSGSDFAAVLQAARGETRSSDVAWSRVFAAGKDDRSNPEVVEGTQPASFPTREAVREATEEQLVARGFATADARMMEALARELDQNRRAYLNSTLMLLATSVSGILYLVTSIGGDQGVYHPSAKVATVLGAFALMFGMVMMGSVDKPGTSTVTDGSVVAGLAIFIAILAFCVFATLSTSRDENDNPHPNRWKLASVLTVGIALAAIFSVLPNFGSNRSQLSGVLIALTVVIYLALLYTSRGSAPSLLKKRASAAVSSASSAVSNAARKAATPLTSRLSSPRTTRALVAQTTPPPSSSAPTTTSPSPSAPASPKQEAI